ncbi:MAG: DivIVA domain-containing protein [Synergistaceae bacterium]|nr:DivIVA domain-containing protein [Synergistaceae bacterium]
MLELLTSLDVVNQSFKKSMRGYDSAEVDEFLDNVAETLQVYAQKTKDLERDLHLKEESLAEYERMKDVLHEALLMAQKSADEKVKSAQAQAEQIISDAREKADIICRDAAQEAERLRDGVSQIRNVRNLYEQEFRGLLAKFDNMLNQSINSSTITSAVNSILEEVPAKDDYPNEMEMESVSSVDKGDLEAAYAMLGVNPKEIMENDPGREGNN